ncbi:TIGR02234 family membrane protein [Streptomyces sp. Ru73]|uniref:TIGR02234 family membrane protein n=1 Tax=Streptomyces sp. Ru73 TaxID=2080748 RepID=UPI000CDE4259|nr:TIGR02234 family membrane protein [Streptomyces sp. Ru73]POX39913.1 TIGR02234 family membrane protein [Streptomyces sp. Ru73]
MSAVPPPRTDAAETDAAAPAGGAPSAKPARRALAFALLLGALGAALALLSSGRTWATATAVVAQGELPQKASGQDVTGVPGALAVVGLAALVAVFAVRGAGRTAVSGLLTLSGAGIVLGALLGNADTAALKAKAATATGMSDAGVHHVAHTAWPWVAAGGGVLLLAAGVLALVYGRRWPAMSGRYERAAGGPRTARGPRRAAAKPDLDRPEEIWKSLDRGEDPTA